MIYFPANEFFIPECVFAENEILNSVGALESPYRRSKFSIHYPQTTLLYWTKFSVHLQVAYIQYILQIVFYTVVLL